MHGNHDAFNNVVVSTWRTAELMESLLKDVPISWELLRDLGELRPEAELPAEEGREGGREEADEEEEDRSRGTVWSTSADLQQQQQIGSRNVNFRCFTGKNSTGI